ncbi:MAG: hypothetical protein R3A78_10845 [Polyangiales bacterium]
MPAQYFTRHAAQVLVTILLCSVAIAMNARTAGAQAAEATVESPQDPSGTLTLNLSDFDCVPATDGSGLVHCNPKRTTPPSSAAPHLALALPTVATAPPVERNYFGEFLGGVAGELVAFAAAAGVGAAAGNAASDSSCEECDLDGLQEGLAGMMFTYAAVAPFAIAAGVTLTSRDDLSYSSALLGAALGAVPGALLMGIGTAGGHDEFAGGVGILGFVLGAASLVAAPILAISMAKPATPDDDDKFEPRAKHDVRVLPTASITTDGNGLTAGLVGHF